MSVDARQFTIRPIECSGEALNRYQALFNTCFPKATHFSRAYLEWLYAANPCGVAVGYDAFHGDRLAAHYACIPARVSLFGRDARVLLSLNTATSPEFQGKGLFTRLADQTYDSAAAQGFDAIYGVANANSTPGFVRKLNFQLVAPLEVRLGIGRLYRADWSQLEPASAFKRQWPAEDLRWRLANPANPVRTQRLDAGTCGFHAPTGYPGICAWSQLGLTGTPGGNESRSRAPIHLFLGLLPKQGGSFHMTADLPRFLRPSPVNFIFRDLRGNQPALSAGSIYFTFLDFDAY